jgi:sulfoxide reductase heme-binding subunit YedZ
LEIVSRVYLTIGFVALLGLAALGATSTDWAVRKLKKNWARLHRIVYGIGVLAALHFFMQSKADAAQATLIAGLFVLLMAYRGLDAAGRLAAPPALASVTLALTALAGGGATMALEYAWYGLATNLPADRIFLANFDPDLGVRPAAWVLLAGLAVAAVPLLRAGGRWLAAIRPRPSAGPAAGRP